MAKHDKFSPKAIANKMKSKGLQKLRWFCQMCQKQCRDQNGFKCHVTSEAHQRQLLLFGENPNKYLNDFSGEFLKNFMYLLKTRFGTKRVFANQVYQEYISDKEHCHMNSTRWSSLSGFVQFLGRVGFATVDKTDKGWYIAWIDKDPETIERQKALEKKKKMDLTDEEKNNKFIEKQIELDKKSQKPEPTTEFTELQREDEDDKVTLKLAITKRPLETLATINNPFAIPTSSKSLNPSKRPRLEEKPSALDEIIRKQEKTKELKNRKDYWLAPNIVVKIITKKLGDRFYNCKGVIKEVIDKFGCKVKLLDGIEILKLDQVHVRTVLPAVGKAVRVVNGAYRGEEAVYVGCDEKNFCATIKITSGHYRGRVVGNVPYEDICKLSSG